MEKSKLSNHIFKKGEFITPFNSNPLMQEMSDLKSWSYGRLPEYLWIALILKQYGRKNGFQKMYQIIGKIIAIAPELKSLRMSELLKLSNDVQTEIFEAISKIIEKDILAPLTLYLTSSKVPSFSSCFHCPDKTIENRVSVITEVMNDTMGHQSNEATDIRYIVLIYHLVSGKIVLSSADLELIKKYSESDHEDEIMRMARPCIRASELMVLHSVEADKLYIQLFWDTLSQMTECTLYFVEFETEKRNISLYMECLYEVMKFLSDLFVSVSPLDEKMKVVLGITTYSYKRLKEVYDNNLFQTLSGRSCVRILAENYMMIKYLLRLESEHQDIWKEYQLYGLGQYKLVLARYREMYPSLETHFESKYIEHIVNEFKSEEFLNIDTRYFNKENIRMKFERVDEKELYDLYYEYDSEFEHGLWGAIRESSLLKCDNPAHQYHCVPDVEDQIRLKSVLLDCVTLMNKTISFIDEMYGIPEKLMERLLSYEIESAK